MQVSTIHSVAASMQGIHQVSRLWIFFTVFVPLLIGFLIYFLSSSMPLFVSAIDTATSGNMSVLRQITANMMSPLPLWIRFHLPDALWTFSLSSLFGLVWNELRTWLLIGAMSIVLIFSAAWEVGQYLLIVEGTFDKVDLLFSTIAWLLAILVMQLQRRSMKK